MSEVALLATRACNRASMLAALARVARPSVIESARQVADAPRLVVPGVGAFGAVMDELRQRGLAGALAERIRRRQPTLCVCVGMQILARESEESPGAAGLGVVAATVGRFRGPVRVPQMGWSRVEADAESRVVRGGYGYYANSFRIADPPADWRCAVSAHGGRFVAALESGPVVACQFHPELSGAWGLELIARWIRIAEGG